MWRLVDDHKSRQALERNAAKKARQGMLGLVSLLWAHPFSSRIIFPGIAFTASGWLWTTSF